MSSIYSFQCVSNSGKSISLEQYKGQVVLIVNVASKCGLTPQYEALEKIYQKYHGQGLEILAFPCNDFMGQEPGTDAEIASFCSLNFGVTFPLFQKITVKGSNKFPLYDFLIHQIPEASSDEKSSLKDKIMTGVTKVLKPTPNDISWNFEKFLVNRNGEVVGRFAPTVKPDSEALLGAIESELKK